ncbi:FHA domain-containing protein [archaeon]|nr:MAG: FHA domain-containing protein [archaeon]
MNSRERKEMRSLEYSESAYDGGVGSRGQNSSSDFRKDSSNVFPRLGRYDDSSYLSKSSLRSRSRSRSRSSSPSPPRKRDSVVHYYRDKKHRRSRSMEEETRSRKKNHESRSRSRSHSRSRDRDVSEEHRRAKKSHKDKKRMKHKDRDRLKEDDMAYQHSIDRKLDEEHADGRTVASSALESSKAADNIYGPGDDEKKEEPQYKPDFGLSGALAKDERTGNAVNGIVLKFTEPAEASQPDRKWRFYVYKDKDVVETLHIHRRSCFLLGRDERVADVPLRHPSCSLQHAVLQYRSVRRTKFSSEMVVKPYIMDLDSTHGTYLNGQRIEAARYYELREGDLLKFATSSRDYVILHDHSSV